ncbi:MAG TPA: DUF3617 domain-containing protein [Thermoanaerobaculia bacterium]|jgi:hypothetical protein|nr:DUF3617 domain-containing protein [Thermoanaerobaculia bacterium]
MRKSVPYILAALLVTAVVLPAAAADTPHPQKPGKWQIKTQMEMPGMPVKIPPVSFEVCVTEEDLKDPKKAVPSDPKSKCDVSDYKIDGNTVTWTINCPKQDTKGTGVITFTENSYTGKMDMTVGEQEMQMKYSGKWLGECTK